SAPFTIQQNRTRTAKFTMALALDPAVAGAVNKADLQYRILAGLDGGKRIVLPKSGRGGISVPGDSPIPFETVTYRTTIAFFGKGRNTFTVVNELPVEEYLQGVVPNELSPITCGQLEGLKAQAVAARTYVMRNPGQSKNEGYDICSTDACQ